MTSKINSYITATGQNDQHTWNGSELWTLSKPSLDANTHKRIA